MGLRNQPAARRALLAGSLVLVLGCALLALGHWQALPRTRLTAAKNRWTARAITHYRLVSVAGTACRRDVEIDHDRIVRVFHADPCVYTSRTIGDLFDLLERAEPTLLQCTSYGCACDSVIALQVMYDGELGYPRRVALRVQQAANWRHADYWRYLWSDGRPPVCTQAVENEIITVLSLTPLP
jgi:hypothetical protein